MPYIRYIKCLICYITELWIFLDISKRSWKSIISRIPFCIPSEVIFILDSLLRTLLDFHHLNFLVTNIVERLRFFYFQVHLNNFRDNENMFYNIFRTTFSIFTCFGALHKKCPYSELFWSAFFPHLPVFSPNVVKYGKNADQNNSE